MYANLDKKYESLKKKRKQELEAKIASIEKRIHKQLEGYKSKLKDLDNKYAKLQEAQKQKLETQRADVGKELLDAMPFTI